MRTATHKLIHYWKQDAWELYDLARDPTEQHNLLHDGAEATSPEVAGTYAELKAEIERLQREYDDEGLYADPSTWPAGSVEPPFDARKQLGRKTVVEAIAAAG